MSFVVSLPLFVVCVFALLLDVAEALLLLSALAEEAPAADSEFLSVLVVSPSVSFFVVPVVLVSVVSLVPLVCVLLELDSGVVLELDEDFADEDFASSLLALSLLDELVLAEDELFLASRLEMSEL